MPTKKEICKKKKKTAKHKSKLKIYIEKIHL